MIGYHFKSSNCPNAGFFRNFLLNKCKNIVITNGKVQSQNPLERQNWEHNNTNTQQRDKKQKEQYKQPGQYEPPQKVGVTSGAPEG